MREEKDVIPGEFTYHRPATVKEAVAILAEHGDEARPLSGGHSLIPMMKLRMAAPEHLIDLAGVESLKGISEDGETIIIGAMTTQHEMISRISLPQNFPSFAKHPC
jgi:carbon-monoxide dehydrogenase medium subunit